MRGVYLESGKLTSLALQQTVVAEQVDPLPIVAKAVSIVRSSKWEGEKAGAAALLKHRSLFREG